MSGKRMIALLVALVVWTAPSAAQFPTPSSAARALNTGLVSYWKLDEASGTRVDATTTGNNLTDNNATGATTGVVINAAQFVAVNTQSLSHVNTATLQAGNIDFTVAAWVYFDSLGANRPIIVKDDAASSGTGREYLLLYSQSIARIQFVVGNGTTIVGNVRADALGAPSTGTWYFVVAWFDKTAGTVNIQVNNGAVDSAAITGTPATTTQPFRIGARPDNPDYDNGRVDEVGWWKRIFTTSQRTLLYNNGFGRTCCPF